MLNAPALEKVFRPVLMLWRFDKMLPRNPKASDFVTFTQALAG